MMTSPPAVVVSAKVPSASLVPRYSYEPVNTASIAVRKGVSVAPS